VVELEPAEGFCAVMTRIMHLDRTGSGFRVRDQSPSRFPKSLLETQNPER